MTTTEELKEQIEELEEQIKTLEDELKELENEEGIDKDGFEVRV